MIAIHTKSHDAEPLLAPITPDGYPSFREVEVCTSYEGEVRRGGLRQRGVVREQTESVLSPALLGLVSAAWQITLAPRRLLTSYTLEQVSAI